MLALAQRLKQKLVAEGFVVFLDAQPELSVRMGARHRAAHSRRAVRLSRFCLPPRCTANSWFTVLRSPPGCPSANPLARIGPHLP